MSDPHSRGLVADIETAVRAIPGVTAVFRAGGSASKLLDLGARALGIRDEGAPLIKVEQSTDGMRVEVAIGVHASAGTVETSNRVQAAIGALCAAQHVTPAEIHITVVHIDTTTPSEGPRS